MNFLFEMLQETTVISRKYFLHLAIIALCALGNPALAADEPSVTLDRPGAGIKEIKEGDNVPDQYQRDSLAIKDWDKRHLKVPEKNEQWVEIQDKYVLVDIPTGTIKQMIKKSDVSK